MADETKKQEVLLEEVEENTEISEIEEPIGDEVKDNEVPEENSTRETLQKSLINLGFVNFDLGTGDNNVSGALVSAEKRKNFKRDVYVGIKDNEQNKEFLGRVVEGPFYSPHEVGADSAITRTTVLHPERTKFRPSYYVSGTIEILGELIEGERISVTSTRPHPYSEIYIFPHDRLTKLLDIKGNFLLGSLMGYEDVPVSTESNNKNFIPRNLGIFGTVGAGKSNTTQVLMEEAINAGWAVVVIDVEGEYVQMNEPTEDANLISILKEQYKLAPEGVKDFHVYVPQSGHSEAKNPKKFKVPLSELDPYVLADLMELSEAQARLLEGVIENARTSGATSGSGRRGALAGSSSSGVQRPFTLQTLIDGLQPGNSLIPRDTVPISIGTLRSKLIRLGLSNILDWNATSATSELPLDELMVGGRLSVLDISETDDRSRNIGIAYTLQALFNKVIETSEGEKMSSGKVRPKVLVVIEEVHTFVSKSNAQKMRSVLDNLQVISRRGRKRWMGLALISQQPGHVPDELFELANTRFIHQLKSATNLEPVKRTTGGVHEALWTNIPSLGSGQCLLTGAVFKNPLFVQVRPAKSKRLLVT